MPKLEVVELTLDDLEWFVQVAAVNMLTDELKRPELINYKQLYTLARKACMDGTAFVVKSDGSNVGALGAILVPNLFNPDIKTLAEVFWYVLPTYRQSRAGALLFQAFTKKAEEVADEATLSLLPSSEVRIESLEKRGFLMSEFAFRKEVT